jgi:hypothetical protein
MENQAGAVAAAVAAAAPMLREDRVRATAGCRPSSRCARAAIAGARAAADRDDAAPIAATPPTADALREAAMTSILSVVSVAELVTRTVLPLPPAPRAAALNRRR